MKTEEGKRQTIVHPIPPLYDADSRILILGSFPSVKSREAAFFYGHPQNRFWKTAAGVLSEPVPGTVEEKKDFLHRNHIAVWDVIRRCDIIGSSDSSIRNVEANDLRPILNGSPIRAIFCNGVKSHEYYRKYLEEQTGMEAAKLPSTSPANAAFSLEKLKESWRAICAPLGAAPAGIGEVLLSWYDYNARILPWRSDPTPYHVWVSEIMLQQTRVEAVKAYYDRWMEELPDVKALAEVSEERLLKLWEGLGYYNRARNLKAAAQTVMEEYGGAIPADYDSLRSLKGVGEYTAGAIASIAFGLPEPAVDGNVLRVFARLLAQDGEIGKAAVKKALTREVLRVMPKENPGAYNQALMDLGATVCLPNGAPLCEKCPWESVCLAHRQNRETDYPVKAPKKSRRVEEMAVFIIEVGNRVALHKRPAKGLLPDLWEFPNASGRYTVTKAEAWAEKLGFPDVVVESLGEGKHIFSHVEWQMSGYRIRIRAGDAAARQKLEETFARKKWKLATREELEAEYAVPSAFERYRRAVEI